MSPARKKRQPTSADGWMAHAESDMNLAKLGQAHDNILAEQVCFHAQQAVEKALKAVLLSHHLDFPPTHDIEALLEIAEHGALNLPPEVYDASQLTPYAVETRYPGYWDDITATDVDQAIKLAEKVIAWGKTILAQSGIKPE